jgi:ribosome-associated toxin RatA of RatAB toxin-antitoxin module
MKFLFSLMGILVISSTLSPVLYGETVENDSAEWNLRKDKHGVKVYTRDHRDEGLLEYKAIAMIEADMDQLVKIIHDVETYPAWTANCESAGVYKVLSDTSRIEYLTTSVPWPLEDRDVVMEFVVTKHTRDYFEAHLTSVPCTVPEQEKYVRIITSEGYWIFKKVDEKSVEIVHQFMSDPGGNIPMWIVNIFIVSGPYKTLKNLKDLCAKSDDD